MRWTDRDRSALNRRTSRGLEPVAATWSNPAWSCDASGVRRSVRRCRSRSPSVASRRYRRNRIGRARWRPPSTIFCAGSSDCRCRTIRCSPTTANLHQASRQPRVALIARVVRANLLPIDGVASMSRPLPMLEHVEFFRGPARESLADRLPELGRETATEIRRFSHAIPSTFRPVSVRYTSGSISATRRTR